jgi:hypothetical protein
MVPRSATDDGFESELGAKLDEASQVGPAGPIKPAFNLFVMNPKDISGDNRWKAWINGLVD